MTTKALYFPRLMPVAADQILSRIATLPIKDIADMATLESTNSYWYPTAPIGQRVSTEALHEFQVRVRTTAMEYGYPMLLGKNSPNRGDFDRSLAGEMLQIAPMLPAEAAQQSVWSFMTLVVAPDVAMWRWRDNEGRYDFKRLLGYPRNAYRRLWWRSYTLGGGLDGPATRLLEDEAVAIMERTSIGGNPRLARAIANAQIDGYAKSPKRADILRDAMKRIRRLHAFTSFHSMTDEELHDLVRGVLEEAATSVFKKP